jgi:hypothetical protein
MLATEEYIIIIIIIKQDLMRRVSVTVRYELQTRKQSLGWRVERTSIQMRL